MAMTRPKGTNPKKVKVNVSKGRGITQAKGARVRRVMPTGVEFHVKHSGGRGARQTCRYNRLLLPETARALPPHLLILGRRRAVRRHRLFHVEPSTFFCGLGFGVAPSRVAIYAFFLAFARGLLTFFWTVEDATFGLGVLGFGGGLWGLGLRAVAWLAGFLGVVLPCFAGSPAFAGAKPASGLRCPTARAGAGACSARVCATWGMAVAG